MLSISSFFVVEVIKKVVLCGEKWEKTAIFDYKLPIKMNMQHFIGSYECKADAKGRILIPVALKKQFVKNMEAGFVLKRAVFSQCLELYTLEQWDALMLKINTLNRFNKKNIAFIRRFTAGVKIVEIDVTGRLLIPKELINYAQITKAVVVSSSVNILEIWDKALYEKEIDEAASDFGALAEEVMGDKTDETLIEGF